MAKRNYNLKVEANVSTAKVDAAMKSLQNKYEKITIGKGITKNLNEASKATKTLGQDFLDTSKKVAKFGAITAVLGTFTTVMYKAVDSILEMDKAQTELKKVSDLSGNSLKEFTQRATEAGLAVSRTGSEMISAVTEFRKSGFTDEQSLQLATTAAMFQNVSDEIITASDAASFLISQMKAFNITADDSQGILDIVNETANKYAVGTGDLEKGLVAAGAALSTYNNSFSDTVSLLTAGSEIMIGKSAQVARGLNTIAGRLVKNEALLKDYGVSIYDTNGNLNSTYEILKQLQPAWESMADTERVALGTTLSGVNQYKVLAAVMSNFDTAVAASETALTAQGSAARENARYMESLQAKISQITSYYNQWAQSGAGVVGVLLDIANGFMRVNNEVDILSPLLVIAATQFTGLSKAIVAGLTKIGITTTLTTGGLNILLGAIALAAANIPKIYDRLTTTQAEQEQNLANIEQKYKDVQDAIKIEKDEQRLKILQAQLETLEKQRVIENQKTAEGAVFGKGVVGSGAIGAGEGQVSNLSYFLNEYKAIQDQIKQSIDAQEISDYGEIASGYLDDIRTNASEVYNTIQIVKDNMASLTAEDQKSAQSFVDTAQAILDSADALGVFATTQELVVGNTEYTAEQIEDQKKAIEELNNALDNIQSAYNTAQSALDEYTETGFISIDTYQSLLSLSPEYLSMLIDESGQLNLNADNVNNLTAAMIDEIGAKQAMVLINTAGTSEAESEALMNVSDAASAAGQSLWDFVTAQAADKIVKGEATDALMSQVNAIKSWADAAKKGIGSSANYTGSKGVAQANKDATDAIRENIKALEKQKSAYETAFKFMQDKIQTEIDKLEEQKSIEEEFWDAKINALKEQNEAIEDQIELQQLQENLAKAKSKKVYRLQGGQFGYFEDTEAVSQAQAALDEYNRKKAYEDEIKRLEYQKKATIDSIETQIKYWEKYKNEWASIADTVEKEQDRMTAEMILGTSLEGENWKTRLTAASGYLDGYRSVVNQLVAENERLNASNQSVASGSGAGSGVGAKQKFKVVAGTSQGSKTLKDGFTSKSDAQAYLNSLDPRAKQFASVVAYAKGTRFAPFSSLANVDENGSELKVPRGRLEEVRYGDQIVPAQQSKNLMEMSKYTPESFLNKAIARIGDTGQTVNNYIDTLKLEGINDVNDFVNALKNLPTLAMQSGSVRA